MGVVFTPFFVLTATTGIVLLWRKTELYGPPVKGALLDLHTWEGLAPYVGVILAGGLLFMTCTGFALLVGIYRNRRE